MNRTVRSLSAAIAARFRREAPLFALAATAAFSFGFGPKAQAATAAWVGNDNNLWSDTGGNWTGGSGPGGQPLSGDSLAFGAAGTSGTSLSDDLMTPGTFVVLGITFNGPSAFTINPATPGTNGFTLGGGITNSSGLTQTINDLITVTGSSAVVLTSATDVVNLGGNITATGATSKIATSGLGTLILSGSNNFGTTGTVAVGTSTTLQLQANAGNTVSGTSAALNTASGKLTIPGGAGTTTTLQLRSDTAVTFNGGDGTVLNATIGTAPQVTIDVNNLTGSGSNNVLSFGTGGLNYTGANLASATVNVTGGNGYSLALGTITDTSGAASGKSLKFNPTTASVALAGFNNTATGGARTLILDGTSSGNSVATVLQNPTATTNVTKSNISTWTVTGAGTYTGITSVTGGTLIGTNKQAFGSGANAAGQIAVGAGTLSLRNDNGTGTQTGQTIIYGGTSVSTAGYNVTANNSAAVINVGNNGNVGSTANTIQLGTLATTANTITTFTNANGYNLTFSGTNNSAGSPTFTNNMANGTLTLSTLAETSTTGQAFTFNGTSATAVTSVGGISTTATNGQAVNVTQSGVGTLFITGSSSNTGTTTVSNGTIKLGNVSALGSTTFSGGAGTLDFNGNSITNTVVDKALNGTILTNTGAAVDLTGMGTISASAPRSFSWDGTGNMTFSQQFTGNGGANLYTATKNGINTVTLSGSGNNTLIAIVNNGTLVLGKTNATAVSGNLTVNGGTAQLAGSGGNQIGGSVFVNSGGVFDLNGQSETVGALSLAGTGIGSGGALVDNNGSTTSTVTGGVTLTNNASIGGSANVVVASAIVDSGSGFSLTKVGAGTATLSGSSTYTGATVVNAGTLVVTGSLSSSSAATVGNAASLGTAAVLSGTGTVGNVTVGAAALNTGATLDPGVGTAIGKLSTGALTFADGKAHLAIQLGQTVSGNAVAGVNNDLVTTSGAVTLNGADLALTLGTGFNVSGDGLFFILNNTTAQDPATMGLLSFGGTNLNQGDSFVLGGTTFTISYTADVGTRGFSGAGNDIALQAVPEPGTWVMLAGAFGMMFLLRRQPRSRKA